MEDGTDAFGEFDAFRAFYRRHGELKHFTARELLVAVGKRRIVRGGDAVVNQFPPAHTWPALMIVGSVVDRLRETLGYPLFTLSSYRSPAYNRAVGGVPESTHQDGLALDVRGLRGNAGEWADAARSLIGQPFAMVGTLALDVRHSGDAKRHAAAGLNLVLGRGVTAWVFRGGIGTYGKGDDNIDDDFVHIDCRGVNRSWSG